MKIAVSSMGRDMDATIAPLFSTCPYFIMVNTDDMGFEVFDNEKASLGEEAKIEGAKFVVSKGANAVIIGDCSPDAMRELSAAHVDVFVGQAGTVKQGISRILQEQQ